MGQNHYAGPIKGVMENGNMRPALFDREIELSDQHAVNCELA
jgi:hypothetical protein